MSTLAAIEVINTDRLGEFLVGLTFNCIAISILGVLTFRRARSQAAHVFTVVVVNIVVFFVTYLMASAAIRRQRRIWIGTALFRFSHFCTLTLPVCQMTYLFAGLALTSFNPLALTSRSL